MKMKFKVVNLTSVIFDNDPKILNIEISIVADMYVWPEQKYKHIRVVDPQRLSSILY